MSHTSRYPHNILPNAAADAERTHRDPAVNTARQEALAGVPEVTAAYVYGIAQDGDYAILEGTVWVAAGLATAYRALVHGASVARIRH